MASAFQTQTGLQNLRNQEIPAATKLRKMLFETNEMIVCPGVYDGLSARTALEVGFDGLYMVSSPRKLRVTNHR